MRSLPLDHWELEALGPALWSPVAADRGDELQLGFQPYNSSRRFGHRPDRLRSAGRDESVCRLTFVSRPRSLEGFNPMWHKRALDPGGFLRSLFP